MNLKIWARQHLGMNLRRDYAALMLLDSRRRRLTGCEAEVFAQSQQLDTDPEEGAIAVQQKHCDGAPALLPMPATV
jgi:hypothetical protein